jgi:hypothetical protein
VLHPAAPAGPAREWSAAVGVQLVTGKSVFDLFLGLSEEQKDIFIKLLAGVCTPKVPLMLVAELAPSEQEKFSQRIYGTLIEMLLPLLIDRAWELLKDNPDVTRERFGEEVDAGVRAWVEKCAIEMGEREREKLKKERDRQSSEETIRRNAEICNLRRTDPKKWSQGRLAKQYDLSAPMIRKILSEEAEWLKLAASLSTN